MASGTDTEHRPSPDDAAEPVDWWRPPLVGHPAAMDSVSGTAAPLLAGFSIALIGVVAQAPANFALPGIAMLTLAVGAVFFVVCVQSGFWARQFLASPAELQAWQFPETVEQKHTQAEYCRAYEAWQRRTSRSYSVAILVLTLGLAVVLVPHDTEDIVSYIARWIAVAVVLVALIIEYLWIRGPGYLNRLPGLRRIKPLRRLNLNWFYPARDRNEDTT